RRVFGTVGIDMIAGPSEILIVADKRNDPAWIAADLLSQAEHDTAAQAILITDDAGSRGASQGPAAAIDRRRELACAWRGDHGGGLGRGGAARRPLGAGAS